MRVPPSYDNGSNNDSRLSVPDFVENCCNDASEVQGANGKTKNRQERGRPKKYFKEEDRRIAAKQRNFKDRQRKKVKEENDMIRQNLIKDCFERLKHEYNKVSKSNYIWDEPDDISNYKNQLKISKNNYSAKCKFIDTKKRWNACKKSREKAKVKQKKTKKDCQIREKMNIIYQKWINEIYLKNKLMNDIIMRSKNSEPSADSSHFSSDYPMTDVADQIPQNAACQDFNSSDPQIFNYQNDLQQQTNVSQNLENNNSNFYQQDNAMKPPPPQQQHSFTTVTTAGNNTEITSFINIQNTSDSNVHDNCNTAVYNSSSGTSLNYSTYTTSESESQPSQSYCADGRCYIGSQNNYNVAQQYNPQPPVIQNKEQPFLPQTFYDERMTDFQEQHESHFVSNHPAKLLYLPQPENTNDNVEFMLHNNRSLIKLSKKIDKIVMQKFISDTAFYTIHSS